MLIYLPATLPLFKLTGIEPARRELTSKMIKKAVGKQYIIPACCGVMAMRVILIITSERVIFIMDKGPLVKSIPIKCDPGSTAANFQLLISEERKVRSI